MSFTVKEALEYMKPRINENETLFAITEEGQLVFQDETIIELSGVEEFEYKDLTFIIESDLEKEFQRTFNNRFINLSDILY